MTDSLFVTPPPQESLDQLWAKLRRIQAEPARHRLPRYVFSGLETRTNPQEYYWDGLNRGADPANPYLVFQYTLAGWGYYVEGAQRYRMLPQMAFTAIIPSDHRYFLPAESGSWTFFFLLLRHPYVVQRIAARQVQTGPVFQIAPTDPLLVRAIHLFEAAQQQLFMDEFAEEQLLFDFLVERERFASTLLYPPSAREQLLGEVRAYVLEVLHRPVDITELARRYDMSRSHFSHHFKQLTGLAPARFIVQVRLEEALHHLLHSEGKIETIARATGFADATHFCKVFRQHYHLSPNEFRKQLKPKL
jgi:AraC-like DNA-binding protein